MTRERAVEYLRRRPVDLAHALGFTLLTDLHNGWMVDMITGTEDTTLQGHRGSYKTTCLSVALALILLLMPRMRVLFIRKTDDDVKEVIAQVRKILEDSRLSAFSLAIWGVPIRFTKASATELTTNLSADVRGTAQLVGLGIGASLTGKHFDRIFTDDIVNVNDRISRAERERTKLIYQELQNVKNRGGRIYNTGTPWHREDAFLLMPNPRKYDCYATGLISAGELEEIRTKMTASLFAANYELRHVAAEDVIFTNPVTGADAALCEGGECHVDAAYGGEDSTAFTVCRKADGKYYVYGRLWNRHVDDCLTEITAQRARFRAGRIYCEDNGDKGYLAKELRRRGERAVPYHEDMNKYLKITSYLKAEWRNVVFVDGTDTEYVTQICDYTENAEHDDAPDSLASIVRRLWKKTDGDEAYMPILGRR